jgi:hypothetical protein
MVPIIYFESSLTLDPKIEELLGCENDENFMNWLDTLKNMGWTHQLNRER